MGEEKDEKKNWWEAVRGIIPNALVQIKNQLGEKVVENLNININVIKDNKTTTINFKPEIPPDTNYENLAQLLDHYLARIESSPMIGEIKIPPGKDLKWVTDQLNTAVNSSTATLAATSSIFHGDFWKNLIPPKDEEDEGT